MKVCTGFVRAFCNQHFNSIKWNYYRKVSFRYSILIYFLFHCIHLCQSLALLSLFCSWSLQLWALNKRLVHNYIPWRLILLYTPQKFHLLTHLITCCYVRRYLILKHPRVRKDQSLGYVRNCWVQKTGFSYMCQTNLECLVVERYTWAVNVTC